MSVYFYYSLDKPNVVIIIFRPSNHRNLAHMLVVLVWNLVGGHELVNTVIYIHLLSKKCDGCQWDDISILVYILHIYIYIYIYIYIIRII